MPLFRNEAPLRRSHLPNGKEQVYDEIFAKQYGFFLHYVRQVIYRHLDCGIRYNGFARVKCKSYGHEYLLAT